MLAFWLAFVGLVATTHCHARKGSRMAFEEAKATPRVDEAETPQASLFLEAKGKQFHQPGPCPVCPHSLLVRALTGQTLVVRWSSLDKVLHCVSERTGVPLHALYLTLNGKCLTVEALQGMDRSSPIPLVMRGWLRGGSSSVPGDWVCGRCHISGCWPTKSRCLRFRLPRTLGQASHGVKATSLAGHRSPSPLRSVRRCGSLV